VARQARLVELSDTVGTFHLGADDARHSAACVDHAIFRKRRGGAGKLELLHRRRRRECGQQHLEKAALQFAVKDCTVDTPIDLPKGSRNSDQRVLDVLSFRRPATGLVTVFLISAQTNLSAGGSSYLNSDPEASCFVQWYGKTEANGRALAHELGHLLGLDHVKVDYSNERRAAKQIGNLMVEGLTTGTDLAPDQIQSAKASKLAKKFGA